MKNNLTKTIIVLITLSVSSCTTVKPWQREQLADPVMERKTFFQSRIQMRNFSLYIGAAWAVVAALATAAVVQKSYSSA